MAVLLFKTLLLVVAAWLFGQTALAWWRGGKKREETRAAIFDAAEDLFTEGRKRVAETGFPRIGGKYLDHDFDLQVTPDTLNYRKLPALWILYTLTEPQPVPATLNIMMRPRGVEPFSNFSKLPYQIEVPLGFPLDCAIRTDEPGKLAEIAALKDLCLPLLRNPRVKELVIAPKGLRLVMLGEEANRTRYLLFRDSEMGMNALPRNDIKAAMDQLVALAHSLAKAAP